MDNLGFEAEHAPPLNVREYLRMLHAYWRGMCLIVLLCLIAALAWSLLQPKAYESRASGLVVPTGTSDVASSLAGDNLAKSKATSYEILAVSRPVTEQVIDDLGLEATPEELLEQVTATAPEDSVEVRITVEDEAPDRAAAMANAWVSALAEQVAEVEAISRGSSTGATVTLQPLGNAAVPVAPSSPNFKLNLVLGMLAGLGLALLYAFARSKMDRRIRSVEELQENFGVSVLGIIPTDDRLSDHREIIETGFSGGRGDHAYSEALRELRTNLSFVSVDNPPRVIVVTSSLPGEGKSSITANLAVAIASTGRNVVVVDGDLRRPVVTELFGLVAGVGVTDVLTGQVDVEDVLQTYDKFPNLKVLGGGRTAPNPTELLASKAMRRMLESLAEDALVLVDAPPLLPVTDAALLTASADGALIVATAQGTTTDEFGKALGNLRQVHGNVLGAVLNRVPTSGADAGYYGYYGKTYYARSEDKKDVPGAKPLAAPSQEPKLAQAPRTPVASESESFDLAAWQKPEHQSGSYRA